MKKKKKKINKKSLKLIHQELNKLIPSAHKVSLFHLAAAIFSEHRWYLTTDRAILDMQNKIEKLYKVHVSDSLLECQNDIKKNEWEFYL